MTGVGVGGFGVGGGVGLSVGGGVGFGVGGGVGLGVGLGMHAFVHRADELNCPPFFFVHLGKYMGGKETQSKRFGDGGRVGLGVGGGVGLGVCLVPHDFVHRADAS